MRIEWRGFFALFLYVEKQAYFLLKNNCLKWLSVSKLFLSSRSY